MLQRTQHLGKLILMLMPLFGELVRFFSTFGLGILLLTVVASFMGMEIKDSELSFYEAFIDLFTAMNGTQAFD